MGENGKQQRQTQLITGLVSMALTVAMLVAMVLCMRQCTMRPVAPSTPPITTTQPPTTFPTTGPTLAANPYGAGDFAYDGDYLTCLSGISHLGVDVSEYQGVIDWQQVSAAGVEFAMIRLGFRAWGEEGVLHEDAYWLQNLKGAKDAGIQVGVYFFSQATDVLEAEEEANFVLQLLADTQLDLPVAFDWETVPDDNARTRDVTAEQLNACAMMFCKVIEKGGYRSMLYFNQDQSKRMYDLQPFQEAGIGFWLAMYSTTMNYPYQIQMWQYTSSGTVPGINGYVDLNLYLE